MKRAMPGAVAALIALGAFAASAGASTKCYVAKDKDEHLEVSFTVQGGKVKRALVEARQVKCTADSHGGARQTIFGEFSPIVIEDDSFKLLMREHYDRSKLSGHFEHGGVKGRTSLKQEDRNRFCETDVLHWKAEHVNKKEWQAIRY